MSRRPVPNPPEGSRFPEIGAPPDRVPSPRPSRLTAPSRQKVRARSEPIVETRDRGREELVHIRPGRCERAAQGSSQWGRYRLAGYSVEALRLVGSFGTVDLVDLAGGFRSARQASRSIAELQRAGLLRVERFRRGRRLVDAATLTVAGKRLMERAVDPRGPGDEEAQSYRAGPARSTQVLHDTAVFRAARKEVEAIEVGGGRVRRIRTDDDLQRLAWRRIESAKRDGLTREDAQAVASRALRLSIRDGKLTFPDVRIEYQQIADDREPVWRHLDVEIATPDYRGPALRAKQAAGFRLYMMNSDGSLVLDGAWEEPHTAR